MPALIAFDADDTLWENEIYFETAKDRFTHLLASDFDPAWTERELYETEMRNLSHFGYGIKGFTLSMIETALDLTQGAGNGAANPPDFGLWQRAAANAHRTAAPRRGGARPPVQNSSPDAADQGRSVRPRGQDRPAPAWPITSPISKSSAKKNEETYAALLQRHGIQPAGFCMVGNSIKSDILPVVALGGCAVHVPYHTTWTHERVEPSEAERPAIPPNSPPRRTARSDRRAIRLHRPKLKP